MNRALFKEYSLQNRLQESSLKPSIYALCDFELLESRNCSLSSYVKICQDMDVKILQYRDKVNPLEIQKKNLDFLTSSLNIPIIINDKIELIDHAHGLHLGQEDLESIYSGNKKLAVMLVRKRIGDKLLGLSTHNEKEVLEANECDLDCIGLGAYAQTSTKDVSNQLGDKLPYIAKMSRFPVCAIGGVKPTDRIANTSYNVIGSALFP